MSLAVFSAVAGLYLAPGSLHPLLIAVAILCIGGRRRGRGDQQQL